jgi:hypothetical protein
MGLPHQWAFGTPVLERFDWTLFIAFAQGPARPVSPSSFTASVSGATNATMRLRNDIAFGARRRKRGSIQTPTLRKNLVTALANIPFYKLPSSIRGLK